MAYSAPPPAPEEVLISIHDMIPVASFSALTRDINAVVPALEVVGVPGVIYYLGLGRTTSYNKTINITVELDGNIILEDFRVANIVGAVVDSNREKDRGGIWAYLRFKNSLKIWLTRKSTDYTYFEAVGVTF